MISIRDIKKPIIIYGTGQGFKTFSIVLNNYNIKPVMFLDKQNNFDNFIPTEKEKNYLVIITVGKEIYHGEILRLLKVKGFKNTVFYYEVYENHTLFYSGKKINLDLLKIDKAFHLLRDKESRNVFNSVLKTYQTKTLYEIPCHDLNEQYFPDDIAIDCSRVIHCGACKGESRYKTIKSMVVFEPDIENYKELIFNLSNTNIIAIPCAVYDSERQLKFNTKLNQNSNINKNGDSLIQCVTIDHVLPEYEPTYIIMDIEGAEVEALNGCEETIRKNKPALAIALYHKPNHLWDIPCLIHGINPDYTFYIRNYTGFVSETVLYAI